MSTKEVGSRSVVVQSLGLEGGNKENTNVKPSERWVKGSTEEKDEFLPT